MDLRNGTVRERETVLVCRSTTLDFDPSRLARVCDARLMNGWTA